MPLTKSQWAKLHESFAKKLDKYANEWEGSLRKAVGLPVENVDCGTGAGGFKKGNTCAKGAGEQSPNVTISHDRKRQVENLKTRFGLDNNDIASIVGIRFDDHVLVSASSRTDIDYRREPYLVATVSGEDYDASYTIYKDHLYISYFAAKEKGKGLGTEILANIVKGTVDKGFTHISLTAAGDYDSHSRGFNGYYTWARFGFDGTVVGPKDIANTAYREVPYGRTKVSELMRTKEGRKFWLENGSDFDGVFDLKEGSLSRRVLSAYLKEKEM